MILEKVVYELTRMKPTGGWGGVLMSCIVAVV